MATITTRVGKGSPLTNSELDANFTGLNSDVSNIYTVLNSKAPLSNAFFLTEIHGVAPIANEYSTIIPTTSWVRDEFGRVPVSILPSIDSITTEDIVTGDITYTGIDLGSPTKRFANIWVQSGNFAANTITIGTSSISEAESGGVLLPANTAVGSQDNIIPTNLADKIELTSLSTATNEAGSSSSLSYDDSTGVFTFTPVDLTPYATTVYVDTLVSNLVDAAPEALDTLNELAAALGDDSNFATTVTQSLAAKASIEYVDTAISELPTINSPTFTGVPIAPTALPGTNTFQIATTAFVLANGGGLNLDGGTAATIRNTSTIALNGGGA
jgi:hypothetical protein